MKFVVVLCAAIFYLGYFSCTALPLADDGAVQNLGPNATLPSGMSDAAGASADPFASILNGFESWFSGLFKPGAFTGQSPQTGQF